MIKTKDKNPRRFDLSEVIFKCELNALVTSINMFVTVKNCFKNTMIAKKQ